MVKKLSVEAVVAAWPARQAAPHVRGQRSGIRLTIPRDSSAADRAHGKQFVTAVDRTLGMRQHPRAQDTGHAPSLSPASMRGNTAGRLEPTGLRMGDVYPVVKVAAVQAASVFLDREGS